MKWTVLAAMAPWCVLAADGTAQDTGDEEVQDSTQSFAGAAFLGFDLMVPAGEFRENVDLTWGLALGALFYLNEPRSLAVRGDMDYLAYGYSRKVRDLFFDAHHTNSITSFGVGPQFNSDFGPGRLFAFGTIGVSQFATSRTWTLFPGDDQSDYQLALTAGGGFSADLQIRDWKPALQFSASYRHHGPTRYGTGGDGPVIMSDANLSIFRVGVSHQF
ncbi:MAG: hypothetical protein F4Y24_14420 [Gemmatimonadetes bacterium]|nr:hypothetical protein [Gemmatimonadota bacterium]MYG21312.1 hypothetical protein [Gemmatimonadota bacterium]MYJ40142.1 hypothetical protein [Gemmatimonadota bacterium]